MKLSQHHREILQAILDGKQLQNKAKEHGGASWCDIELHTAFCNITNDIGGSSSFELRIKPEPKRLYGRAVGDGSMWQFLESKQHKSPTHYIDILDGDIVGYGKLEK
jgi:hypothetical protein